MLNKRIPMNLHVTLLGLFAIGCSEMFLQILSKSHALAACLGL